MVVDQDGALSLCAEGAQYIGLVGATLAHPRAWTAAAGGALSPAMELDPRQGVTFHHEAAFAGPAAFRADVSIAGKLTVTGEVDLRKAIVASKRLAHELPAEASAADLVRRAAAWGSGGVRPAAASDRSAVLGIVAAVEGQVARVVLSGVTATRVAGAVRPGDWLEIADHEAGALKKAEQPQSGALVAKALEPTEAAGGEIKVLVCLA
ncbi:hypothetical protein BE21_54085 [Sorangium cellulosum]|uniref:Uncharacterized protein n=1 Tax=Sorangium cellulosum TaxID=56 RepID=A0A150TE54_SORCE|nr:hypothetical protein BE21_54085 [Sorangium cellulosum]